MANEGTQKIYLGRFISTPDANTLSIRTGAVLVSGTTITKTAWQVATPEEALTTFGFQPDDLPHNVTIETTSPTSFFFPGFIDTHIHAPQYPNCGIFGKSTLLDWLTTYTFPLEASLAAAAASTTSTDEINASTSTPNGLESPHKPTNSLSKASKVYNRVISRTLSNGTTTASYFATIDVPATNLLASIAKTRGQRALIGRVCMDHPETCPPYYRDETPDQTLLNAQASMKYCHDLDPTGHFVAPIITPRFAPSCQGETLSRLGQLAQETGTRVQTHISENTNELLLVASLFPERSSYTDVYDHAGLLTPRTILAHGIHLSDPEIATIATRGSKISHCPASNSSLGSGFCPVRKLLESGIDVSLGTDVSGGYSVSILDSVRQCCLVSRQLGYVHGGDKRWNIGVTEGLWLGTVGGAKCVGWEGRLGGFEQGMWWDVQEIEIGDLGVKEVERRVDGGMDVDGDGDGSGDSDVDEGPVDIFGWETWEERIDKWVWNGDDRNVKRVWVGGRLVHSKL